MRRIQVTGTEGFPAGVDDVVVMPDARQAFLECADEDIDICWGARAQAPRDRGPGRP